MLFQAFEDILPISEIQLAFKMKYFESTIKI